MGGGASLDLARTLAVSLGFQLPVKVPQFGLKVPAVRSRGPGSLQAFTHTHGQMEMNNTQEITHKRYPATAQGSDTSGLSWRSYRGSSGATRLESSEERS